MLQKSDHYQINVTITLGMKNTRVRMNQLATLLDFNKHSASTFTSTLNENNFCAAPLK
jgi:hypothetical protein